MSVEAPVAPAAPAAPAAPKPASQPTPNPGGAQGAQPAPPGTIPPPLRAFSDRPDSAKSKAFQRLRDKTTPAGDKAPAAPAAPKKEDDVPEPDDDDQNPPEPAATPEPEDVEGDDLLGTPKPTKKPAADQKAGDTPPEGQKKQKVNPWKLIDEHKTTIATKDKEMAELKKLIISPEARKSEVAELETLRSQVKELTERIRYVDYQSHPEFTEKYEKPYRASWSAAMKTLRGVTVANDDGTGGREMVPQDLLELVNLPPAKARQLAIEKFGDYANDVMLERDKIRTAYDAREGALEGAKTEGSKKLEAEHKARYDAAASLSAKLKAEYETANEKFSKRRDMAEFFQDIDGDDDANEMLRKGYALVDEAFGQNVMDENLTDAQRASIIKRHAAVRHRAAGFGRARYLLAKERADHAVTKAKLAEFQSTVPNRGSGAPAAPNGAVGGSRMEQMKARLRARAS